MATQLIASSEPPGLPPDRPPCPHCGTSRTQKWGRFSGRQRFRCVHCLRTFSTFTGTALHYLKRLDAWPSFCEAMRRSFTVARAARHAGVHPDTAFRWRHRFLATLLADEHGVLQGPTAVGVMYFRYSRKGSPNDPEPDFLQRAVGAPLPPSRSWMGMGLARRFVAGSWVPVVWARDLSGFSISLLGPDPDEPRLPLLIRGLSDRVGPDVVLHHHSGPLSSYALCAGKLGLPYVRNRDAPPSLVAELESTGESAVRLKRWLCRFRGVATKYLPHYLAWFRALDTGWSPAAWDLRRLSATL